MVPHCDLQTSILDKQDEKSCKTTTAASAFYVPLLSTGPVVPPWLGSPLIPGPARLDDQHFASRSYKALIRSLAYSSQNMSNLLLGKPAINLDLMDDVAVLRTTPWTPPMSSVRLAPAALTPSLPQPVKFLA